MTREEIAHGYASAAHMLTAAEHLMMVGQHEQAEQQSMEAVRLVSFVNSMKKEDIVPKAN